MSTLTKHTPPPAIETPPIGSVLPEITPGEWNSDDDEFCIMDPDRPDWSLCGLYLPQDETFPYSEVPDEITCAECLSLQRAANARNGSAIEH